MHANEASRDFHRCGPAPEVWRALRAWYRTPLGERLLEMEARQMDAILPNLFGYHLLQVGRLSERDMLSASRISHCVVMDALLEPTGGSEKHRFYGEPMALPIACGSLDVLYLPHVLEFSDDPRQVLREADRTLIPEGRVILQLFNPWSCWALRGLFGRQQRVPWCGRFLSVARVKDWLALLDFDVDLVRYYFYRPPLQHEPMIDRLAFLERAGERLWPVLGAGYVLVARKRVATLTPIRPRWRPRRRLATGLVEPFQGKVQNPCERLR